MDMTKDDSTDSIHELRDRLAAAICAASSRGATETDPEAFQTALEAARNAKTEDEVRVALSALRAVAP